MVFATTYHDSGYREWEGLPRMDVEKGRPYGHRERIPEFEATELKAYGRNVDWVRGHDLYAGLLVSMHRTGLWRGRYDVLTSPKPRIRDLSSGVQTVLGKLEDQQQQDRVTLAAGNTGFEAELWINYRMLQLFDLLSLYFCCDGYGDVGFKEECLAPIPAGYSPDAGVEVRITPRLRQDGALPVRRCAAPGLGTRPADAARAVRIGSGLPRGVLQDAGDAAELRYHRLTTTFGAALWPRLQVAKSIPFSLPTKSISGVRRTGGFNMLLKP